MTSYTPGGALSYTIVVANAGPSDVDGATVTDAVTGLPLADVDVHAYTSDGDSYIVPGTSNADGEYVSGVVPAGTVFAATDNPLCYLAQLWDGLPVHSTPLGHGATIPVAAGEATRDIDFALVRAGSISGTVTTIDGTPLDFTTVRAYRSNGEWAAWDSPLASWCRRTPLRARWSTQPR